MRRRATMAGLVAALAVTGLSGGVSTASASDICGTLSSDGTLLGPRQVGPICAPYARPVICTGATAGPSPQLTVTATACVPAP